MAMNNLSLDISATAASYSLRDFNEDMRQSVMPVTVIVGVECVIGVFGNLLVLLVFKFSYKPSNFRYFVLCLCVTDLLCSLTTIPFEIVTHTYWFMYPNVHLCKTKSFLNMFTVCSECLCLVIISIDRYRKVCKPHGWQISERMALYSCLGLYVISAVLSVPVPFFWGLHVEERTFNNVTFNVTKCEKDQEFLYSSLPVYYTYSVYTIAGVFLIVMFVLYFKIAKVLFQQKRKTNVSSKAKLNECTESDNDSEVDRRYVSSQGDEYFHGIYIGPITVVPGNFVKENNNEYSGDDIETSDQITDNDRVTCAPEQGIKEIPRSKSINFRSNVRRKTLITIILTVIFMVTTIVYFALLLLITENYLVDLTFTQRSIYFFFFRLYFINHVINPIVYGILDTQFKTAIKKCTRKLITMCPCTLTRKSVPMEDKRNSG